MRRDCFKCDEKWGAGHWCPRKELNVLLMEDNDGEETDANFGSSEQLTLLVMEIYHEVSLNSVVGSTNPKTMNLLGKIGGCDVMVIIDHAATHNFLSLVTVEN